MKRSSLPSIFRIFLLLGCTSFGGPVAHLGYFREAFVQRRRWFSDEVYADIVALAQFLPGPASSQVGMAIGLARGGLSGMVAAWLGFTLPSAVLMAAFAFGVAHYGDFLGGGWIGGLKAAAAAVVLQALVGMARSLTPDWHRRIIALCSFVFVAAIGQLTPYAVWGQVGAIALGGVVGPVLCRPPAAGDGGEIEVPVRRAVSLAALALFALLLVVPPFLALAGHADLFDRFYRAGALVFGGGHVVLPLLQAEMVEAGLVDRDAFLAGYGAAQAVPGPLFTFSAYLGGMFAGLAGAMVALLGIFLPSMLLTVGALPFWAELRRAGMARRALAGVNAAVVGLLAAAFADPIGLALIERPLSISLAVAVFLLLWWGRIPVWALVVAAGLAGGFIL